jgi:acyl-CoA reductase-like NAD-dependent aldehyde dehydrogenase
VLVFEDADITSAVNGVAFAAFVASGQTCVSATRLLVHEGIYEDFMPKLVAKVEKITRGMGDRE